MSRFPKPFALAAGLSLAVAACAGSDDPGVRTESAQADLVFGVAAPEDAEIATLAPPPPATTTDAPQASVGQTLRVPFRNKLPDRFSNVAFSVGADTGSSCPDAPLGAAAQETAGRNAEGPPAEGLYRFRVEGTRTLTVNGVDIPTEITGFQPRIVRDVEMVTDTSWRFEVIEPLGEGTRIRTWIVKTDPTELVNPTSQDSDGDGVPDGRGVKPPYVGENPVRAGEPDRGIALEQIQDFDADGNPVGSFDAVPALLHMPLPVLSGEAFQSVAVDRQGQVIQIDGEVLKAQAVDACGELADGWLTTTTVTAAQSLDSARSEEEWVFSTPMGGLPILHHVTGQTIDPATGNAMAFDLTYSLGQLEPSPIPGDDA